MKRSNVFDAALDLSTNRRGLMKKLATAGAVLGAAHLPLKSQTPPAGPAPADVVQFALNLEYLEAEFYSIAATGQNLQQRGVAIGGQGTAGPTTTVYGQVNAGNNDILNANITRDISDDEINHVKTLRAALTANGVTPVAKPAIDLDALAPLGASLSNLQTFLVLARAFEDIGVSAYSGGAAFLAGSPYLGAAARILAVEGEHTGAIRLQISLQKVTTAPLDAADILPPPSGSTISAGGATLPGNSFSTSKVNGLVAARTPGQVLYLAYGFKANATAGGFFPNGVNGTLNTSSSAATASALS